MKAEIQHIATTLAKICRLRAQDIHSETDLFKDLGIDSFAIVELFVELENLYQTKLNFMHLDRSQINTPEKITRIINSQTTR